MILKNWNPDFEKEQFGAKDVPEIKLSLVENDKIVYEIIFTNLSIYKFEFYRGKPHVSFSSTTMNPEDFQVLVSKKYDKYFVETANYWKSTKDCQDYPVELPCQVYTEISIFQVFTAEGEPTQWKFIFD